MSSVQARREHQALVAVHQAAIIDFIASFADQALRVELMLTPKPGRVDQRNSGAHHDMDLQILLTSARAIAPWWPRFVQIGYTWASMPAADFLSIGGGGSGQRWRSREAHDIRPLTILGSRDNRASPPEAHGPKFLTSLFRASLRWDQQSWPA